MAAQHMLRQATIALLWLVSLICWSLGCVRLLNHIYLTLTTLYLSIIPLRLLRSTCSDRLFWFTGVVFSNGTVLSILYDLVNKCTQRISESIKLHILGVWQNACEIYQATDNKMCQYGIRDHINAGVSYDFTSTDSLCRWCLRNITDSLC